MKIRCMFRVVMAIVPIVLWVACGGSSSSTDSASDTPADTPTETPDTGDTVLVSDLSELPNLDLDGADVTANISAGPSKSIADGYSTLGATSKAGCYGMNFLKPTALAQLKQSEMFKCYIEKTQAANSSLTIPTDSYGYYLLDQGASAPVRYVAARVGNFVSDSVATLKMEACNSSDGSTFTKMMELSISGNTVTKTWSGFTTSHMELRNPLTTPDGEEVTHQFNNSTFSIVMDSAEAMQTDFDLTHATDIDATSVFGRNPSPTTNPTAATTYNDGFRVRFIYDKVSDLTGGPLDTVSGTFSNGSTVTGVVFAKFNDTIGAGKLSFDGPGSYMDFNSAEAYTHSAEVSGVIPTAVVNETGAAYSAIYAAVSAEDLSALAITVPDDVTEAVAWGLDWGDSCTLPSGASFTNIDASAIDYSTCNGLSDEVESDSAKTGSCFGSGPQ